MSQTQDDQEDTRRVRDMVSVLIEMAEGMEEFEGSSVSELLVPFYRKICEERGWDPAELTCRFKVTMTPVGDTDAQD